MSRTLRWVFILLPCVPGLTLLAAACLVFVVPAASHGSPGNSARDQLNAWRVEQLAVAGGAVLSAGLVIGAFVAWRIDRPRPEPDDDVAGQTSAAADREQTSDEVN